jgi:hypothetical protein
LNAGEWGALIVGAVLVLASVYAALLIRGAENERVISAAVAAMAAARSSTDTAPQRALLRSVAAALLAQERAAAKIEVTVYEFAQPGFQVPEMDGLVEELLALPEPQSLVADFLAEHGGGAGTPGVFDAFAADIVGAATEIVYADLDDESGGIPLRKLLVAAMDGRIEPVARAAFGLPDPPPPANVPRMEDASPATMERVAGSLDQATRRQLRLATLLHGQAEAILRLRGQAEERERRTVWRRVHRVLAWPRLKLHRSPFQPDDLTALEVAFDAVGEVIETAAEYVDSGQPSRAMFVLAGVQVPVPGGLPGRIYNQNALSQVRPLTALGVWHRLAVCRWAAAACEAIGQGKEWPPGRDAEGTEDES